MWGYVRRTCVFSRKAFLSINNKWLKIPTEIARWAYLSINRNQVSRKGFAGQQNNPLFFKDSKSCLSCPDMRTFLDEPRCDTKLHAYAARQIMPRRARAIAEKSAYSNNLRHLQRSIYPT